MDVNDIVKLGFYQLKQRKGYIQFAHIFDINFRLNIDINKQIWILRYNGTSKINSIDELILISKILYNIELNNVY